jgi:hypothetical protein
MKTCSCFHMSPRCVSNCIWTCWYECFNVGLSSYTWNCSMGLLLFPFICFDFQCSKSNYNAYVDFMHLYIFAAVVCVCVLCCVCNSINNNMSLLFEIHVRPDQIRPDIRPDQPRPDQIRPDQTRSDQARPDRTRSDAPQTINFDHLGNGKVNLTDDHAPQIIYKISLSWARSAVWHIQTFERSATWHSHPVETAVRSELQCACCIDSRCSRWCFAT